MSIAQLPLLLSNPRLDLLRALLQEELAHGPCRQTVLPPGCELLPDGRRQLPIAQLLPLLGELTDEHTEEMIGFHSDVDRCLWWATFYERWRLADRHPSLAVEGRQHELLRCRCAHTCTPHRCPDFGSLRVWQQPRGWAWSSPAGNGTVPFFRTATRLARSAA